MELAGLEQCCGFGDTFAIKNAEVSSAMLAEKTLRRARPVTTAA